MHTYLIPNLPINCTGTGFLLKIGEGDISLSLPRRGIKGEVLLFF
jgi:hypothetical protein